MMSGGGHEDKEGGHDERGGGEHYTLFVWPPKPKTLLWVPPAVPGFWWWFASPVLTHAPPCPFTHQYDPAPRL